MSADHPASGPRSWTWIAGMALLYGLIEALSLLLPLRPGQTAPLWLNHSMGVVILLALGRRSWGAMLAALAVASVLANVAVPLPAQSVLDAATWQSAASLVPGSCSGMLLGALLLDRANVRVQDLQQPHRLALMYCLGSLLPSLLGATIHATLLADPFQYGRALLMYLTSSLIGDVAMLPLAVLVWLRGPRELLRVLANPTSQGLLLLSVAITLVATTSLPHPFVVIAMGLALLAVVGGLYLCSLGSLLTTLLLDAFIGSGLLVLPPTSVWWGDGLYFLGVLITLLLGIILGSTVDSGAATLLRLAKSQARLGTLYSQTPAMLHSLNPAGSITAVSQLWLHTLGFSESDVEGRLITDFMTSESALQFNRWADPAAPWVGASRLQNIQMKKSNGELIDVEISAIWELDAKGAPQQHLAVVENVTEIKRLAASNLQAEQANRAAQELSKAKDQFLANMSHEIRTPMNAIIGLTDLALRTSLTPSQQDYLGKVHVAAHSLLGLLNDILDLSKVESGKFTFERIPFSVTEVLDGIEATFKLLIEERGKKLRLLCAPDVPHWLTGDPLRLSQVLSNLVSNANKFSDRGDIVVSTEVVNCFDRTVGLRFAVTDSGVGITPDQMLRLFEPFSQADESTTRRFGGTGLGLAISRQIVELMGGRIWVNSEPGHGSTFTFEVSFERAEKPSQSSAKDQEVDMQALRPVQGARILLVEDNAINQQVAAETLAQAGFEVDAADNGARALAMLASKAYDLVLMDIQMPVLDGYAATTRIRAQDRWRDLPVIAMTANVMDDDRAKAKEAGMNDHIAKPIVAQDLFAKLLRWIPHGQRLLPSAFQHSTPENAPEVVPLPDQIPGLELPRAILTVGGNQTLLRKLLTEFAQDHGRDDHQLLAALQGNEFDTAQHLAHTLKGVAGTIGATFIQQRAASIEAALREGRHEALQALGRELQQAFEPVRTGLQNWLEQARLDGTASSANRPNGTADPLSQVGEPAATPKAVHTLIRELELRLRNMDLEAADLMPELVRHLSAFSPKHRTLAETLHQHARNLDFEQALDSLKQLTDQLS